MQLWWEFQQSPEARAITSHYQENLRLGFKRWFAWKYPEEAAAEYETAMNGTQNAAERDFLWRSREALPRA